MSLLTGCACDPSTLWAATAAELWLASVCFVGGAIWCFSVTLNFSLFALWNTADKLHLAVAMTTMSQHKVVLPCCCMMQYADIPVYSFLLACFLPVYWGDGCIQGRSVLTLCTTECRSVVVYTCLLLLAVFCTINKPGMQHRGVYSFRWEAATPSDGSENLIGSNTRIRSHTHTHWKTNCDTGSHCW